VLAALTVPVQAQNASDVVTQREASARLLMCDACHEAGRSKSAAIPIIAGQQEAYLLKQLRDFRTGARSFEIMKWMAESFSDNELAPAAAYVAKKSWPAKVQNAAATQPPRGIAVCQACHAQNYMGAVQAEGVTTPRLAGQGYEYLVEAM